MAMATLAGRGVAKKKQSSKEDTKQTMIRVSEEFAEAIREASSLDGLSMREFLDLHYLELARKHFRDAILKRAKQFGGEQK